MKANLRVASAILRREQAEAVTGYSRSTIYLRMRQGLLPKPVALGSRAVGWPASEIEAINAARIAGKSEAEIRQLVSALHAERSNSLALALAAGEVVA